MEFHTFGNKANPVVILIHGALTPWQMWEEQAGCLKEKYFVIIPSLDAHTENTQSEFISAEDEADKIADYVSENFGKNVHMLCGLSLGGVIAYRIFERSDLTINRLVLDGAPLVPISPLGFLNGISEATMKNRYISIIRGSKKRDRKTLENFVKYFMPEKYLESYLKFADKMSEESVKNMVRSACGCNFRTSALGEASVLFLCGTKPNELISKKAARKLQKSCKNAVVKSFKGYAHGELAIYKPEEWLRAVGDFM